MTRQSYPHDAHHAARPPIRPNMPGKPTQRAAISAAALQLANAIGRDFAGARSIRALLSNAIGVARVRHKTRPVRSTEIAMRCRLVNEHERLFGEARFVLDDAALTERMRLIQQAHDDLWSLGYKMRVVDYFKPRHAQALLDHWRASLSRGRIEQRWTALRWWVDRALEKVGVVPPLEVLWPPEAGRAASPPNQPEASDPASPVSRPRATRDALDMPRVIGALMEIDERAGWILRLKTDLGLTVLEAGRIDPVVATAYEHVFMTLEARGRTGRTIVLDSDEKRATAAALRNWGRRRARGFLAWPELDERQVTKRFDYLQTRARSQVRSQAAVTGGLCEDQS